MCNDVVIINENVFFLVRFCSVAGGPLMYFDTGSSTWVASGIVSYGATECGTAGVPGVYTRVERYIDWIYSKLEK